MLRDEFVDPQEKRRCRLFRQTHHITWQQHAACLSKLGWNIDEWDDGVRAHVDGGAACSSAQ